MEEKRTQEIFKNVQEFSNHNNQSIVESIKTDMNTEVVTYALTQKDVCDFGKQLEHIQDTTGINFNRYIIHYYSAIIRYCYLKFEKKKHVKHSTLLIHKNAYDYFIRHKDEPEMKPFSILCMSLCNIKRMYTDYFENDKFSNDGKAYVIDKKSKEKLGYINLFRSLKSEKKICLDISVDE